MDSTGISFTALFTGHVWYENGMSASFFTSPKAELMYKAASPFEFASQRAFGFNVHDMLLQRHHIIDYRIDQLVKNEGVTQILEIACGFSPRGFKLSRKYPGLKYIEADLPNMAKRKTDLLQHHHGFGPDHQVVPCDIFESNGQHSLEYIFQHVLDPSRPTIIITEGLVNYFKLENISRFWKNIASLGQAFPRAWYLTDLVPHPKNGILSGVMKTATQALSMATHAKVNLHFKNGAQIDSAFRSYGFSSVQIHHPKAFKDQLNLPMPENKSIVRVIEAQIHP